jgi:hypothetical protein
MSNRARAFSPEGAERGFGHLHRFPAKETAWRGPIRHHSIKRNACGSEDWMFPNSRKTGPIWHEDLLSRCIQPVADELGLPHITWRLLRH